VTASDAVLGVDQDEGGFNGQQGGARLVVNM